MDHLNHRKLNKGERVAESRLVLVDWVDGGERFLSDADHPRYKDVLHIAYYFNESSEDGLAEYLGPDDNGIEPVFERCSVEDARHIATLAKVASSFGLTGEDCIEAAEVWDHCGFDWREYQVWHTAGVWNAYHARQWRDAGLIPEDVKRAAAGLAEGDGALNAQDILEAICDEDREPEEIIDWHMTRACAADDDDSEWWIVCDAGCEYAKTWDGAGRTQAYAEAFRFKSAELAEEHGCCRVTDEILRQTMAYQATSEDGGDCDLDAETMEEAIAEARDWIRAGDYPAEGCRIRVRVEQLRYDGEVNHAVTINVEIEPDHDALIRAAGGNPDCDHDWTSEGEGGCSSNPGVWSCGGTTMKFASHCRHCGLHRVEIHHGSQRNPDDHDTVTYTQPEQWCAECESEKCCCN
jgi:hypothetical protein